jgi:outer membrane protein OmpA-like peptidoglycan-associated protein
MKPLSTLTLYGALHGMLWAVCAGAVSHAAPAPRAPTSQVERGSRAAPRAAAATGRLAQLRFAPGSAVLPAHGDEPGELDRVLRWARTHPDGLIIIDGHADPDTSHAHGLRLSLRRAKAVRALLVTAGTNPEQIVIAAFAADGARDRSVVVWGTPAAPRAVATR